MQEAPQKPPRTDCRTAVVVEEAIGLEAFKVPP